jgi:D-lactate dehydrogenase
MHAYFYEAFEEEAAALKHHLPEGLECGFTWKTIQEAGDKTPPAPLISTRIQSAIPAAWHNKLTGILTRSTGYDHLVRYLGETKSRVPCGYLPLYCVRAVAEQAILLMLSCLRKLPLQMRHFENFNRDGLTGTECAGKKLLVVGVGNIGSEVVKIGLALGMEARGVDIAKRHPPVNYVPIEEGLPWADVIVCAMNLTADNANYFHYQRMLKAKPGVVFINIARGELSTAVDLLRLYDDRIFGGIGLDVFGNESLLGVTLREGRTAGDKEISALLNLGRRHNVILTPHNAFNTGESVERKAGQSFQQVAHFLKTGKFLWPVPEAPHP